MRFRLLKSLSIGVLSLLLAHGEIVNAVPSLVSLKHGHEGKRYWAAFVFDQNARWLGVSQSKNGNYAIYFSGNAKDKDGERLTMDDGRCIVGIQQVGHNPSVFKANVQCDASYPVAIIRRAKTVVIGLNDPRLLTQSSKATSAEDQYVELISVTENQKGSGMETRFQFSDDYDWMGFFKTATNKATLLFAGVSNMSPVDSYMMSNSIVKNVRLLTDYENPSMLKVDVDLASNAAYTMTKKNNDLVITGARDNSFSQDDNVMAEGLLRPQEESLALWEDDPGISSASLNNSGDLFSQEQANASMASNNYNTDRASANTTIQDWTLPSYTDGRSNSSIPWEQVVSFEFTSTPIKDALRLIAASNNLNMVIGENVTGTVTMSLQNVTLRQAIERILHTHNMEYLVQDDIITVKPVKIFFTGGMQTKVYRLRYADATNVARVVRRIASNDSLVEVFNTEFLNYETSGANRKDAAGVGVQGIRRASMLVVTDRPEKIREIDSIILELDRAPIQIMIESKLVEVAPYYLEELGIDWDETLGAYLKNDNKTSETGAEKVFQIFDQNDNVRYENTWKMGRLNADQYLAVLDVLKTKTDATLRLNPRILAMNDEESSISVGTTVPIPEIQQSMGGGSSERVTFDYKEINVQLNVTPHVGHNNEIVMYVNPVIEEISDWVEFGGQRAPITAKRAVNSIVSIKNGETIVIGGLIKNQKIRTTKKVWLLGSLPLLGRIFQHTKYEDQQTDLMIFITPTIVE
ncbi:secretin N-terminal domain-containing protein [bacterium]